MTNFYSDGRKPAKTPLSQASGKKKLLVGVPVSLIGAFMWAANIPFGSMLSVILGAYAIVGLIEVVGGDSLKGAAGKWDTLAGWKKFLIAIGVICGCFLALGLVMAALPQ